MTPFTSNSTGEEVCKYLSSYIKASKVLITGVTPGSIGGEAAIQISRHAPSLLVLAGRNIQTLQELDQKIKLDTPGARTRLLVVDLSSQESVRKAAEEVKAYSETLDIMINSAGVMATPYSVTKEGLEMQFGTNHIGHFLFTNLVLENLIDRGVTNVRVVNVSSLGHKRGPVRFEDPGFENGKCYDKWQAYGQSKTANMLFSVSLAKKLGAKGVQSFSLYPGRMVTGIVRHLSMEDWLKAGWKHPDGSMNNDPKLKWITTSHGAATLIVAAYTPSIPSENGSYMVNCKINNSEAADYALDPQNAEKLWRLSEDLVGQEFRY
ncbi:short-chain dehydrogenase [Penicillium longicatenatum]|uniref:short-chain dehydrogenase n=1 Tax=Penicillium longicatenatum TaxID=1561947 RepID=UPI0025492C8C|nr:short-chain dehydrogenase [Penicillium longicatenatum]KAJ5650655.1 short-chain dehydrogenase [Penicillium longicatenatum]